MIKSRGRLLYVALACLAVGISFFSIKTIRTQMSYPLTFDTDYSVVIKDIGDVHRVYPTSCQEIQDRIETVKKKAQELVKVLHSYQPGKVSFKELFKTFDGLENIISTEAALICLIQEVHPDETMREAAQRASLELDAFSIDIWADPYLYELLKSVENQKSAFKQDDVKLYTDSLRAFKKMGHGLSVEKKEKVTALLKELSDLSLQFSKNINDDVRTLDVKDEELAGVSEDFKKTLEKKGDMYQLRLDYPTSDMIMNYCMVGETRKRYAILFSNRAYPANMTVLDALIKKRHEMAQLLGYENYAAYNIDGQTMQTPAKAWDFELGLKDKVLEKAQQELDVLNGYIPRGVTKSPSGKRYPWDIGFVTTHFKKQKFNINEQELAEYFPMKKTIDGLIAIYEQFFDITITSVDAGKQWHTDVELLQVADKKGTVLGYVFLDMFPRPYKYSHAAQFGGVKAIQKEDGTRYPAVVTLVCNFTKPTADKPSLLKFGEVNTFFHEFGHALHSIFGATRYNCQSGTATEQDFVELPSQMLENWLEQPEILKNISSHYITNQPLSDELIEKKLALIKALEGMGTARQMSLAMVCLDMFDGQPNKDTDACIKKYFQEMNPYTEFCDDCHMQCSFGHLIGYGASYYGYLWSLVRGADIFDAISKQGLLNPQAGKRYMDAILSKGGSVDGNTMIRNYLGRDATYDAFYKKIGLEQ